MINNELRRRISYTRAIYLKELCQLGQHYAPVADWSNPIT